MHSLTTLPFPCGRDTWIESLTLYSVTLRKKWCWQNQVIPLMHFNASKSTFFFIPIECWNFFWKLDFHKGTLINWYLPEFMISTPRPWLREDGASSQAFASSTASTEVCLPITQCTVGWESSQVPDICCWITWSLQRHLCVRMPNFCCIWEGYKT